jgi:hypothetical protein
MYLLKVDKTRHFKWLVSNNISHRHVCSSYSTTYEKNLRCITYIKKNSLRGSRLSSLAHEYILVKLLDSRSLIPQESDSFGIKDRGAT